MILLGACAGLRIGDAAKLTWNNIDLERKVIRYFPQKTAKGSKRKPLETIILPDLEDYLLSLPLKSNTPDAPLFPTLSKKTVSGDHGLSLTFGRLIQKAGIDREVVTPKAKGSKSKGRQFFALGFHSLRHTYISIMANMGVSQELRMKLAGHTTSNAHEGYSHHETEAIRKALKDFPRFEAASKTQRKNKI